MLKVILLFGILFFFFSFNFEGKYIFGGNRVSLKFDVNPSTSSFSILSFALIMYREDMNHN